jgi:hypothetical protein
MAPLTARQVLNQMDRGYRKYFGEPEPQANPPAPAKAPAAPTFHDPAQTKRGAHSPLPWSKPVW